MNRKLIPRKYRKQVVNLVETYKDVAHDNTHLFTNWNEFLMWRLRGTNEGWLLTNDKEYQALLWLIGIKDMMSYLDGLESESE